MRIAIGLPTNRLVKPKTLDSILNMMVSTRHEIVPIVSERGYNTAENKNRICALAIKRNCDYIFLADDDMIYDIDNINDLVDSGKDIIGGLYFTKYEKQDYVQEFIGNNMPDGDDIFECEALGGGLVLISTKALKKIPQPWFGYKWFDNGMVEESNDWYFCHKAKKHGFKIYCDPMVTAKHIGIYCY